MMLQQHNVLLVTTAPGDKIQPHLLTSYAGKVITVSRDL